jgi:hypothetical protein
MFAPAWVYAALVLVLVPVAGGVGYWLRGKPPDPMARPVPTPQRLFMTGERGEGSGNELVLPPRGPLAIEFHVPVLSDGSARYTAILQDAGGNEIWSGQDLESLDAFGTFLLLLDSPRLAVGEYRLRVIERDATSEETLQEFVFPFVLRR